MRFWRRYGGGLLCLAAVPALAQTADAGRAQWLVEPRVSAQVSMLDRTGGSAQERSHLSIYELSPGLRLVANAARVKGSLDYALMAQKRSPDVPGTSSGDVWHTASGTGQIELVDGAVFVDATGMVSRQAVSAFGPQGSSTRDVNQSQTITGTLSPSWKGMFMGDVAFEARYIAAGVLTKAKTRADSLSQGVSLHLGSRPSRGLGWALDASRQDVIYSGLAPDTQSESYTGTLSYAWSPQVVGRLTGGQESSNQLTRAKTRYNSYGAGLVWRPSDRASLSVNQTHRYFGEAHDVSVNYRFGWGALRFSDARSVSTSPTANIQGTAGSLYSQLDAFFTALEPDPVARAKLVEAELRRRGLPTDPQASQGYLTSQASVQRQQQASVVFQGTRQSLMFSVNQAQTSRLNAGGLGLGDDLASTSRIRSLGWNVALSHRLTPRAALSAQLAEQKNIAQTFFPAAGSQTASLSVSHLLGPRTNCAVQWRRTRSVSAQDHFAENALVGNLSHRF